MRRRSNRDYFGPARGFKGFLHRIAMILLYPLRKPLIFFPLLILLYLVPTFIGAKPSEVHLWYWNKIKNYYDAAIEVVVEKVEPLTEKKEAGKVGSPSQERGIDQLVGTKQKAVRRQMFEKAKTAPVAVDILENEEVVPISEVKREEKEISSDSKAKSEKEEQAVMLSDSEKTEESSVSQGLPLVYLENAVEVSGEAVVQNANEIVVNGTYIFLYGIYADPDTIKGIDAKEYLVRLVRGKAVRCEIVAYTYQDIATAFCYVGDENINQRLVDKGFSRNVAL